jgi:hypothetical protein
MAWVRIDDGLPDHPKFLALGRDRWVGIGLFIEMLCYANRYLTDGAVPAAAVRRASARVAARLADVGLIETAPDGWRIHDYHRYQPSREDVEARRTAEHEAKVAGGRARAASADRQGGRFASAGDQQATSSPAGDELAPPVPAAPAAHQQAAPAPAQPNPTQPNPKKPRLWRVL